jgi:protein-disulfide isomerase/uncharacterized membrane protein
MATLFTNLSNDSTVAVTQQLLHSLQIPFSFTGVKEAVKQHPDYPSIAAVHDVLTQYKTENIVLQVDKEKLQAIPVPFIAHLVRNPSGFVTVTNITGTEVTYLQPTSLAKGVTITTNEFLDKWSAVTLLAEKNERSGETNLDLNRKTDRINRYRLPLLFLLCTVVLITAIIPFGNAISSIVIPLLLKLAGVVVCSLLLWYEIDRNNPFLQKVCNSTKATNCNAVLQSNAAKLFGVISWSEIGYFYFAGGLLFVMLKSKGSLALLAWLNLIALPYTIFSVLYQWRVSKQWCPLCLAVQGLLLLEAIFFISFGHLQQLAVAEIVPAFVLAFLVPVTIWYFVKPLLKKNKEAEEYKNRFYRIKNDSRIFEALLEKQKQITIAADGLGIRLGNPDATHTIVKVCNPYCGPCANAHPDMHRLLHDNPNLAVQIIFTPAADEKDYRNKPVKHLLAVAEKKDEQLTELALDTWYMADKKDYDLFAAKFPMNGELKQQDEKVEAMYQWCNEMKIEFTPTFFVNGHQLPENYNIRDLNNFLSS